MRRRSNLLGLVGMLVIMLGFIVVPTVGWAAYGDLLTTINSGGLSQPAKIAVDSANGDVYVTDAGNKKVNKYDKSGNYNAAFSLSVSGTPVGIAVTANNILVGDDTNNCVWIYNKSTGALADLTGTVTSHKLGGASGTSVSMPNTIAIDPIGHIFVVDGDNDKVYIYNVTGMLNSSFGASGSATSSGTTINLYNPSGIAFADSTVSGTSVTQRFYIGDQGNFRVQKLSYVYNSATTAITTAPTYASLTVGTGRGDSFGKFLRVSDVAWDNALSRLLVVDSLQMVAQIFTSAGIPITPNAALNYSGTSVQGNMNIPTGIALDAKNQKVYTANNQGFNLAVFTSADGNVPAMTITSPASAGEEPCTPTYTVNFGGTDSDSASVTASLYYYNTATPTNKILFSTQTLAVTGGAYNGSAIMDLVGIGPNYLPAGIYGVYGEVMDSTYNRANNTAAGTISIINVPGQGNYTCTMAALFGPGDATDSDNDGLKNADEINGTHNAAYGNAPTDPYNADSDGDGLDDGVEEGQVILSSNTTVTLTGGSTVTLNPNSADTDGGGTSDGIEIVKGTSPTTGTDDLVVASSAQDQICEYFIGDPQLLDSVITLMNSSAGNIVVDLDFYNLNGTLNKTVPGILVKPLQLVTKNPYTDYGISDGSVEVRATSSAIRGDLTRTRKYYLDPLIYDNGAGFNMSLPSESGTTQYLGEYIDTGAAGYRFLGTIYIKNWTDSTANVTVKYSDGEVNANPLVEKTYILAGHETKVIRPKDEVTYKQGALIATSDKPITVAFYVERWNATDPLTYDVCYGEKAIPTLYTQAYTSLWCDTTTYYALTDAPHAGGWLDKKYDYNYRFINYFYMHNFSQTDSIDVTVKFNDMSGNLVLTKTYTLPPNGQKNIRPMTEGANNLWTVIANPAIPLVVQGTAEISATGPFSCMNWIQRLNVSSFSYDAGTLKYRNGGAAVNLMDYSYLVPVDFAPATTHYVSSYYDWANSAASYPNDFIDWVFTYNPSATDTANLTVTYYNPDGTVNLTKSGTGCSIGPHKNLAWKPFGTQAATHTGSIKIESDQPFVGFTYYQRWRYNDFGLFDYAIGRPLW